MEKISKEEARAGTTSRKHKVFRVLAISIALAMIVWFFLEMWSPTGFTGLWN